MLGAAAAEKKGIGIGELGRGVSDLVIFTGHPGVNLWQPAPVPAKTRTRRRGCGFFAGTGAGFHTGMRVAREPAGGWINKKYCITTVQYVQYYMAT